MYLFLVIFFTFYGLLNLYFLLKINRFLELRGASFFLLIFIILMFTVMPVVTRIIEKKELFNIARITAYMGYFWMVYIFLFFVISIVVDIFFLIFLKGATRTSSIPLLSSLLLSCLLIVYGFFEATAVKVEVLKIKTNKLPSSVDSLKIAQISDLHLGLIIREKRVEKVINIVRDLTPDIVVVTGDMVDGQINDILKHTDLFNNLRPPLGKFAVTGNHEYYAGIKKATEFIERSGFKILRNETIAIEDIINIAGIDDGSLQKEREVLTNAKSELFTLFLKHRPLINEDSLEHFDLQLSGHTHKGQIFPFYYITKLAFPLNSGLYGFKDGKAFPIKSHEVQGEQPLLYVSKGAGTWGPPVRIFAQPEVTLIILERTR